MTDSTKLEESLVSLDTYLETNYSDVNLSNLTETGVEIPDEVKEKRQAAREEISKLKIK